MKFINLLVLTICTILSFTNVRADSPMLIGAGIADVTGQVTEIGFMGYAYLKQIGTGLHFRSRARAFIFVDRVSNDRMVYVSMDLCMGFELLKTVVIEKLQEKYGKTLYTKNNVIISGTHTHSAPGGMAGTILADLTIFGFNKVNFDIAVTGLVNAIERAHDSLKPGRIFMGETELDDASINRSPASYLQDPEEERNLYKTNTDNTMTVLRLQGDDNTEIGAINFFPVHPVSMNETNTLSSGDNKGLASMMFEHEKNPTSLPGHGKFVAAFGQANCGDVSPNTKGPICIDTGLPCDFVHSTCNGKTEMCIASGPGNDMWESTQIIAQRQYEAASKVYNSQNLVDVTADGKITYRHSYVNFQEINVDGKYTHTGKNETTCEPAMGYSFAGGTTDGPGALDFTQGNTTGNPFWNFVSGLLSKPTAEQSACHAPKPILLNVGSIKWTPLLPEWTPYILPLQIAKIGELFFVAVPGEFTTMSGRRLRNTITKVLQDAGVWSANSRILLCGLSNSYSHYIATWEEYQIQRYEGGSTLYGPHTLAAYQQEFSKLATDLALNNTSPAGPTPQDTRNITIGFVPEPPADTVPTGSTFGSVFTQPAASYKIGQIVTVVFWCASPRNDPQQDGTYLTVESVVNGVSSVVMDDSAWETKFHWKRIGKDQSQCTIEWDTTGSPAGTYQIRTFGASKDAAKVKTQFQGVSNTFTIA